MVSKVQRVNKPDWSALTGSLLAPLAGPGRIGLVTDVDGTLSPIVADPATARVTPRCQALLAGLRPHLALTAAVSGRSAADVVARFDVPGLIVVGNHGLERWQAGQVVPAAEVAAYRPALAAAAQALERALRPGMQLEDKGATLSVHYRRADDPAAAEAAFGPLAARIAGAHGLRLYRGRMVFELRPPLDIHKGTALRSLVRDFALTAVLYLGDDTTDVDALRAAADLRAAPDSGCYGVGVGVLAGETPLAVLEAADALADGVSGVEALLAWLLVARSAAS